MHLQPADRLPPTDLSSSFRTTLQLDSDRNLQSSQDKTPNTVKMASEAASAPGNPLLSTQSSELQAVIHPLVLLSISDYITRHTLRDQPGPIVGGLLGQHNGREVTMEHAFDCHIVMDANTPYMYRLNMGMVLERIEQRKLHPQPSLA